MDERLDYGRPHLIEGDFYGNAENPNEVVRVIERAYVLLEEQDPARVKVLDGITGKTFWLSRLQQSWSNITAPRCYGLSTP